MNWINKNAATMIPAVVVLCVLLFAPMRSFPQILSPILFKNNPAPPPPPAGMLIWYVARLGNNCSGACTNGASQSSWADQSGSGNNGTLTPVIVSACVASVYNTNQINGQPAVQFNGTAGPNATCFARGSAGTAIPWSGQVTEFIVMKKSNQVNEEAYASGGAGDILYETSSGKLQQIQKATIGLIGAGTATTDANWHQLNFTYNSSTGAFAFRKDRAGDGSGTATRTITATYLTLGMDPNSGGRFTFSGQVAEFILYNTVLSAGDITTAETWLNYWYGL